MTETNRVDSVVREAAVLVGVLLPDDRTSDSPLEELEGLAQAAGARVVGQLTQRREKPDPATYMGKGKVDSLKRLVDSVEAEVVLFDNDLSPGQTRNLERDLEVKVLDRTELILDIFAGRARTYEARLAVELAQLEYSLPRLKRLWTHLSRQKKGMGVRGPGEKQLESDRRLVEKRINDLRSELAAIHRRKEREVATRRDVRTVSLVGYTNAGKSTLLNLLTGADVLTQNALFSTLDTRTRRWHLPGWGPILLSDTVGFIRGLPHHLIASFRATLEEARQADLLLHVADGEQFRSLGADRCRVQGARRDRDRSQGHDPGCQQDRCGARPGQSGRDLAALPARNSHQRPDRRRPAATGRRGERGPEPDVPGRRRRDGGH